MKQLCLITFLLASLLFSVQAGKPRSLGNDFNPMRKSSAMGAALLLGHLGSRTPTKVLYRRILKQCVHLRFLGRKLYRKFQVSKKVKKSRKHQKRFAQNFVRFVLRSLLKCRAIARSSVAYKLRSARRRARIARRKLKVIRRALKLAKVFRGPKIDPRRKRDPNTPRLVKKFTIKNKQKTKKGKKVRKAVKKLKGLKALRKRLQRAQKKCRRNKFRKNSPACRQTRAINRHYRRRAKKVRRVLSKSCRKLKVQCFKRKLHCKKMFLTCKKARKLTKSVRFVKAAYFARVFAAVIRTLN